MSISCRPSGYSFIFRCCRPLCWSRPVTSRTPLPIPPTGSQLPENRYTGSSTGTRLAHFFTGYPADQLHQIRIPRQREYKSTHGIGFIFGYFGGVPAEPCKGTRFIRESLIEPAEYLLIDPVTAIFFPLSGIMVRIMADMAPAAGLLPPVPLSRTPSRSLYRVIYSLATKLPILCPSRYTGRLGNRPRIRMVS